MVRDFKGFRWPSELDESLYLRSFRAINEGWHQFFVFPDSVNTPCSWEVQPSKGQDRMAGLIWPDAIAGQLGDTLGTYTGTGILQVSGDAGPRYVLEIYLVRGAVVDFFGVDIDRVLFNGPFPVRARTVAQ